MSKKDKVLARPKFPKEDDTKWVLPPIRVAKKVRKDLERESVEEGLTITAYARQMIHKGRIAAGRIKKTDLHA